MNQSPIICIYCKNQGLYKSKAHIFPEGLVTNDFVLPAGIECDSCNNYFKDLESSLLAHNHIWTIIQHFGIPGKKGKKRKQLGLMSRTDDSWKLSITQKHLNRITILADKINVESSNPKEFDDAKFRRALYHIGFNFLASRTSSEYVLLEKFDSVRNYIRSPHSRNHKWPYKQVIITPIVNRITLRTNLEAQRVIAEDNREVIVLKIFADDFYLDLLNNGTLQNLAINTTSEQINYSHA